MTVMRPIVAGGIIVAAMLPGGATMVTAAAPSAKLEYKMPKSTTLGEPAIMLARVYNTTGYRVMVDFGIEDQTEFVFRQTKPDGTLVTVQPTIARTSRLRTSRLVLRGAFHTAAVVLDQWLDLSQLGRHLIVIEYRGSVEIEGGDQADVKRTAQFAFEVKPQDVKRLDKRAVEWLKHVSTLSRSAEARAAATALTVIKDPVVVPYLELATARTRSATFVDALVRMNRPESRLALERLARSADPEVRSLAQTALGR